MIDEYGRVGHEGKMALLLGRSVKSLEREGGERVDECVMDEVVAEEEGRNWFTILTTVVIVYSVSPKDVPPDIIH